jgi:hypothetical protein
MCFWIDSQKELFCSSIDRTAILSCVGCSVVWQRIVDASELFGGAGIHARGPIQNLEHCREI